MIISLAGSSVRPRFMSIIAGGDLVFSTENETIARVQVDSGTFVFDKSDLTAPKPNAAVLDNFTVEPDSALLDLDKDHLTEDQALDLDQDVPEEETYSLQLKSTTCQFFSAKLWIKDANSFCCSNGQVKFSPLQPHPNDEQGRILEFQEK
ncbi:hypothetical protein PoB_006557400 [Plakobranchus ocellatus]|uniref:Uncharacterized protein n=1 Tax=Plakobranchus ocellatus TaxID=259542 RepID=A0AAV4D4H3_9GAST|nr:hypothetical protein PoB_006557400 [Plakobranchus ocellatus]